MYAVGIDIGGMSAKIGLVLEDKVVSEERIPTRGDLDYREFVEEVGWVVNKLSAGYGVKKVGISSCGIIDSRQGAIIYSNNIRWENKHLASDLAQRTGLSVRLANDAKCATLAEAVWGAGKAYDRVCMLTLGTGVGGGFVLNKHIEKGSLYADGDGVLGHITVENNGRPCTCGRRGCLEMYASATAIMKTFQEMTMEACSAQEIFERAREGEPEAKEVVEGFRHYLGEGLVSLANVLRPEVIVLGGGVSGSADMYLDYLNEVVNGKTFGGKFLPIEVVKAKLGNAAGMIGAALL